MYRLFQPPPTTSVRAYLNNSQQPTRLDHCWLVVKLERGNQVARVDNLLHKHIVLGRSPRYLDHRHLLDRRVRVVTLCDPIVQSGSTILPFSLAKGPVHLYSGGLFCAVGTPQYTLGTNTVLLALAITAAVFVSLTIFTLQSKWDFSFLGAGLGVSLFLLIIWGLCMQLFGFGAQMQYLYRCASPRVRACASLAHSCIKHACVHAFWISDAD